MSSSNRTNIPNSLNEHWMPFTDNKTFKKNPRLITDAKGVYLTNHQGKKMIDASLHQSFFYLDDWLNKLLLHL